MSASDALPQSLVAQFRATSLERLERIESAWAGVTQRMTSKEAESELFHDVHTLKGEARLVGFADVALITQRLEELLFAARRRRYRVHEDVDVVVTMAIQFVRMLLRKRAGSSQGGIDLNGFLKHIDEVLTEWPRQSEAPDSLGGGAAARAGEGGKVSVNVRQRFGVAATEVFLESLASPSPRLRRAWEILSHELAQLDAVALMPLVRRHAASAKDLAVELGKEVDVAIDGHDVRVGIEVLDSIHTALVHVLRNAVDHGIEPPDLRASRGKSRRGTIIVRIKSEPESVIVTVQDDGAGADIERIRERAVSLGLLPPDTAAEATDAKLLDLVFAPGFTVREAATDVSGRGIGMDAVRAGIEKIRGTIEMRSKPNAGVTVSLRLPQACKVIDVHRVPSTRKGLVFAIPTTWTVRPSPDNGATKGAIDPVDVLGFDASDRIAKPDHVVVSRDRDEYVFAVGGPVTRSAAVRTCPTPPDRGAEIVEIDDEPAVLLRPDALNG